MSARFVETDVKWPGRVSSFENVQRDEETWCALKLRHMHDFRSVREFPYMNLGIVADVAGVLMQASANLKLCAKTHSATCELSPDAGLGNPRCLTVSKAMGGGDRLRTTIVHPCKAAAI